MEPQKRTRIAPAQKVSKPSNHTGSHVSHLLALILASIAIVATYYMWEQSQHNQKQQIRLEKSLNQLLGSLDSTLDQQGNVINELAAHKHPQILERLDAMSSQQNQMRLQLKQNPQEWTEAEVDYLLNLAQQQYQLLNNLPVSRALLIAARNRLIADPDNRYEHVITRLAADIDSLERFTPQNSNANAEKLNQMIAAADTLPVAPVSYQAQTNPDESSASSIKMPPTTLEDWKQYGNQLIEDLNGLFRISNGKPVAAPINQSQHFFFQQSLRLKLETARLAFLTHNDSTYQQSLKEAQAWLNGYFDPDSELVKQMTLSFETLNIASSQKPVLNIEDIRQMLKDVTTSLPHKAVITPSTNDQQTTEEQQPTESASQPPVKEL
jgi:uncharacterized protein HemX